QILRADHAVRRLRWPARGKVKIVSIRVKLHSQLMNIYGDFDFILIGAMWNETAPSGRRPARTRTMWLKALLGEGVALNGGTIAIVSDGVRMRYHELAAKSDRLAAALIDHGVRPGDRVVLFMDTSAEGVVAMLAILKAGAVLTPIDPATSAEDLAFV